MPAMLKFVHTRPPRAKSPSPAGSTASLDRASTSSPAAAASPRHRDRSYPPFPPLRAAGEGGADAGLLLVPRSRVGERSGGRASPGSGGRTSSVSPARSTSSLGFEVGYDRSASPASTYPARDYRGRVLFPSESELFSVGRFPVTDRERDRRADSGQPLDRPKERRPFEPPGVAGRAPSRDTSRDRQASTLLPGHHPSADRAREKSRTSSPRDRHVRISPYPVEEIPASIRPAPFPVPDRDRALRGGSSSPSLSAPPPQSILTSRQQGRDRTPPHTTLPAGARLSKDTSDVDHLGPRGSRRGLWGAEEEHLGASGRPRALTAPSAPGGHRSWAARPHEDSRGAVVRGGSKGREAAGERGRDWDSAKGREGEVWRDGRFWKPKLFFSGSWLHGPSRHRIFATRSAQPQPQPQPVCMVVQ